MDALRFIHPTTAKQRYINERPWKRRNWLLNSIKTVLFDLGNVLVHIDPGQFWKELGLTSEKEINPFKEEYISRLIQYETGDINTDDFLSGLCSLFTANFSIDHLEIDRLEQAFSGIIREQITGMTDIVQHISSRFQTALVSNTNEIHYNICLTNCKALQFLQKHYLSYQLLAVKPSSQFYEAIIKDQNAIPSELLFIDDSLENVNAAKAAGMKAVHFENVDQLKIALESGGILKD